MYIFRYDNLKEKIEKRKRIIIDREVRRLRKAVIKEIRYNVSKLKTSFNIFIYIDDKYNEYNEIIINELLEYFIKSEKFKGINFSLIRSYTPYFEVIIE